MNDVVLRGHTVAAMNFLEAAHPGRLFSLTAIKVTGGPPIGRVFAPQEREQAAGWIDALQGVAGLYYSVNEVRPDFRGVKATKADIVAAHYAHVDIDHMDGLEQLKAYRLPPSIIVFSGGGYQAFWKLAEPTTDLERVERINRQLAADLGGDNCHNIDRIMRLPGTINLPNAKKRKAGRVPTLAYVVDGIRTMETYDLDQFNEFRRPATDASSTAVTTTDAAAIALVNVDQLPASISEETRRLIMQGDDANHPIGTPDARFPSRSEVVFCVACALARAGWDAEKIAGLLLNPACGISESILEKTAPDKYALKQARSAVTAASVGWPDVTAKGKPRPTLRNAIVAFQRLGIQASYDMFRRRKMVQGHKLEAFQGEMTDDLSAMLRKAVLDEYGFDPGREYVRDALHMMALENSFHPIRDYLSGLEWDGKQRLDTFLIDYLGAEDTPLNRAIGRIVLIAAVRRVRQPGCKFDEILVLEGKQGTGKSTALAILAGPENHSDQDILTLDAKGQMEALAGKWIYELGELEGIRKAESTKVKAFASRSSDRARMAYGYFAEERPRECIFVGTTNDDHYLSDPSGNRRFWPVRTGAIDLEALVRDRDQLWAEAASLEAAGEPIRLPRELWEAASVEQAERTAHDPWLDTLAGVRGEEGNGTTVKASTKHLLTYILNLEVGRQRHPDATRLGACMRALGWDGPKSMRVHGVNVRGYERPQPEDWRPDMAEAITARKTNPDPA